MLVTALAISSSPMPPRGERQRVHHDGRRVLLLAEDKHLPYARHRRDALCDVQVGILVELCEGHDGRGQTENENGMIGRIDLLIGGRRRKVLWEIALRGVDGRGDVAGRAIEAPGKVELKRDLSATEHARRRDLVDARQSGELSLERLRDRCSHCFRVGPGQAR